MKKSIWKKGVRKDTSAKSLGLCHKVEKRVYTKEEEGLLAVKRRERGSASICRRSAEKGIYSTFQVTPNFSSTFCGKKEWNMKNSVRLSIYKPVDNKKQISLAPHSRYIK